MGLAGSDRRRCGKYPSQSVTHSVSLPSPARSGGGASHFRTRSAIRIPNHLEVKMLLYSARLNVSHTVTLNLVGMM